MRKQTFVEIDNSLMRDKDLHITIQGQLSGLEYGRWGGHCSQMSLMAQIRVDLVFYGIFLRTKPVFCLNRNSVDTKMFGFNKTLFR